MIGVASAFEASQGAPANGRRRGSSISDVDDVVHKILYSDGGFAAWAVVDLEKSRNERAYPQQIYLETTGGILRARTAAVVMWNE